MYTTTYNIKVWKEDTVGDTIYTVYFDSIFVGKLERKYLFVEFSNCEGLD